MVNNTQPWLLSHWHFLLWYFYFPPHVKDYSARFKGIFSKNTNVKCCWTAAIPAKSGYYDLTKCISVWHKAWIPARYWKELCPRNRSRTMHQWTPGDVCSVCISLFLRRDKYCLNQGAGEEKDGKLPKPGREPKKDRTNRLFSLLIWFTDFLAIDSSKQRGSQKRLICHASQFLRGCFSKSRWLHFRERTRTIKLHFFIKCLQSFYPVLSEPLGRSMYAVDGHEIGAD